MDYVTQDNPRQLREKTRTVNDTYSTRKEKDINQQSAQKIQARQK